MIKIMFVCYGNICRSPMAEFMMRALVAEKEQEKDFYIASSATSSEELGNPVHYGTKKILDKLNIECSKKRAVKLKKEDYDKFDYFIGMEEQNACAMKRIFGGDPDGKISLLMDYTPFPRGVADPYWTGDFSATEKDVAEGVRFFYDFLKKKKQF